MSKSSKPWPKLSDTLPRMDPCACQQCGATEQLVYWQECDDEDQGTRAFVILCRSCSDQLIEKHPRLYRDIDAKTPMPGAMPICLDCNMRVGKGCASPVARFNGGPGLEYEPKGQMVHLCRVPRSKSGWQYFAEGPVTKCSGKVEK